MSTKKKIILISLISLGVILALLTGLVIYGALQFQKSDKILKNVTFEDVYIGSLTKEEATSLLKEKALSVTMPVTAAYGEKTIEFAPEGAGITYDFDEIVNDAYSVGRDSGVWDLVKSKVSYIKLKENYITNIDTFTDTIDTLMEVNNIDLYNYEINVYENYASVRISDDFKMVDYEALLNDTMSIIKNKEGRNITIKTKRPEKVTAEEIYELIHVEPVNASSEVIDGKTIITPHTIGILLDINDIEKNLSEGKTTFNVPITKKYPEVRVEHLEGGLFNQVLGTLTTTYNPGLIGRTKNVTQAARNINGVILNPGEIFSYNKVVGPRTVARGFSTGTVFTSSGLVEELGGGICQVSSTLYNAVLYADLKIVERRNHMYAVSYVKNSLDATVSYGSIDFKFQNTLNSPIKIATSIGGGKLTVSILGIKENNNRVEIYSNTLSSIPFGEKITENPQLQPGEKKVTQNGSYGYRSTATRVVKDASGNIIRQETLSSDTYMPLNKIVEAGPEMATEPDETVEGEAPSESTEGEEKTEPTVPEEGEQATVDPEAAVDTETTEEVINSEEATPSEEVSVPEEENTGGIPSEGEATGEMTE